MKIPKLPRFRFSKSVKIKIDRKVCDLILTGNQYISKKDLGAFISELLLKYDDLDSAINDYVSKKYSLKKITGLLKRSNKKIIPFREIREMLDISKRKFYPRLKIIKKYLIGKSNFKWTVKRGKFVRLN
ncbi:MAG: hypothetical protein V1831_01760 [Candidatus Woesearchaeota archaeon]